MSKENVLNELKCQVGTLIHQSNWIAISQTMIDAFANATDDHQWIHIDQKNLKKHLLGILLMLDRKSVV